MTMAAKNNRARKKPATLAPTRPNAGVEKTYQAKLERFIDEMNRSVAYWVKANYRANEDRIALDVAPAKELSQLLAKLSRQWIKAGREYARDTSRSFVSQSYQAAAGSTKGNAKKVGFKVEFDLTRNMKDALALSIEENVALINSIRSKYFEQVQIEVYRSVAEGRDLEQLTDVLQEIYGKTRERAAFIAKDQNNKATATITRTWQRDAGITQAMWVHSHAGKVPRPSHVKAGKEHLIYDVNKGAYLDGVWTWPGQEINCRCISRSVIPGLDTL